MRSILIILLLMLVVVSAKSQKWQPGYFMDIKNNRMDGLINPNPGGKSPVKDEGFIAFKTNKDANEIKLSCSDLKWFVAGKDSFVVAHPPNGVNWAHELDFVKVALDEQLKLYVLNGSSGKGSGSGVHFSPGFGLGVGGGSYAGGGVGISLGGGGGNGGRSKAVYYFGVNTAELTELNYQNFEDVMSEIMGDEPEVVEQIKAHRFGMGNLDKLINYFKQVKASHQ
ncbi:hypothetical protein MUY27_09360 [Mucilaginibacter sp. RS28]|uniref:Uncharacterized protein n=1 Tax=Mucilaginibacter straminoryzae TaxID=2932774 RepID=A0A9X1X3J3_9SPHI|nr:hypothetical protein [Mucilaginibacter straminoryzae]MCJ8209916.1 hypothetical protein [Mucilaginibacter straminoryzae]